MVKDRRKKIHGPEIALGHGLALREKLLLERGELLIDDRVVFRVLGTLPGVPD